MRGLNLDSHLKGFMASLHKFQEKEVMTDVTLILPDQSAILCHKVVLMAASPFFETMFQSGLKEGAEQNIKLDFADSDIIKTLVEFFYTGDIELTEGNIKALVAGSEFLCCKHLKAHCEEYLVDTVDISNCIDYYRYGQVFNLKLLIKTAFDFILFKFRDFREISDFDKLTEDELVEVVSCDRLNAENEDVVFEAVVLWVNADPDAREEIFPRIAPLIRFPFCSQTALTNDICCNPLMQKPGCIDFALEALWSQFHFNCRPPIHNARCIPRLSFDLPLFRLTASGNPPKISISTASCVEGNATEWKLMMCDVGTGLKYTMSSPSVLYWVDESERCYSLETSTRKVSLLPWKDCGHGKTLACVDGKIFAFGGNPEFKSVKSFDVKGTNPEWKTEKEMLHALRQPYVVQHASKIYVFGESQLSGYGVFFTVSLVCQEFDPGSNEWRLRSEMPGPCERGAAVALNDRIYVVGGTERVCFSYDPANDEWKVLSQPTGVYVNRTTATVWKGKILLGNEKHVEEYDPIEDRWCKRDDLVPGGNISQMVLHASCTL